MTIVIRIDMADTQNLDQHIRDACDNQLFAGRKLASSFVFQTQLVLIFQRLPDAAAAAAPPV